MNFGVLCSKLNKCLIGEVNGEFPKYGDRVRNVKCEDDCMIY